MRRKGWSIELLEGCVERLSAADFHKSQAHVDRADTWLDIYRPVFGERRRYLKIVQDDDCGTYVVMSFCDDGELH